jgi:hypothetical protein
MILKTVCRVSVAALAILCVASASAAPVVWYLDGVVRDDGGTVSGSFTYDAAAGVDGTYSSISITSTAGTGIPGQAYGSVEAGRADFVLLYPEPRPADLTGSIGISLDFTGGLAVRGGAVDLGAFSFEFTCADANCSGAISEVPVTGQVTTSLPVPKVATPVPTMPFYGLLLMVLGVALVASRRLKIT